MKKATQMERRWRAIATLAVAGLCVSAFGAQDDFDRGDGLTFVAGRYLTVDLSSGAVAEKLVTDGKAYAGEFNVPECKTAKMAFRLIPAGSFQYGGRDYENGSCKTGRRTSTGAYAIGVFPVTAAQFARLVGEPCNEGTRRAKFPRTQVSWNRIREDVLPRFNRLVGASGYRAELPSEVEWERACRAGTTASYYFFDDTEHLTRYAHFRSTSPLPVGEKTPNGWGLFDMSGNVWEWTTTASGKGTERILRGGSYDEYWGWGTSSHIVHRVDQDLGGDLCGFRLVLKDDRGGLDVSSLPTAAIDCGGRTFDFAAISASRFDDDGQPTCDRALSASCFGDGPAAWKSYGKWKIALTERPFSFLDGRFAVSEGQCGMVQFGWKYRGDFEYANHANIWFRLELPAGYDFLGTNFGELGTSRSESRADGSTVVTMQCAGDGMRPSTWMNNLRPLDILIRARKGAPEGTLFLTVTDRAGKPVSGRESIVLYTVPPVAARAVPKRFRFGVDTWNQLYFRDTAANDEIAGLLGGIGARWMVLDYRNRSFHKSWRKMTGGVITPFWTDLLENGYHIGPGEGRPREDRFVCDSEVKGLKVRKSRVGYLTGSACPMAIYEERPFFMTNTVAKMREILEGADGLWANWEPSMFECKGCWCENCKRAFAAYAKLSQREVDAGWPQEFREGGSWYALGRKFRSWQHGKVIRTIDRHVKALTGGEKSLGFSPAVCHVEMSSYWRPRDYPGEVKPIDYAGDLKWIEPWGPYCPWKADKPFRARRHATLTWWASMADVRRTVDSDYPAGRRPKIMAYPNGLQCGTYVTQPEYLSMAMDSAFFNRWDACCVYFFPNGYDARYLKEYARAVERAAIAEEHVLDGRLANDQVTVTPVGEYAVPVVKPSAWIPATTDVAMLQTAAFDHRGSRVVAALNFWDLGPAFFQLRNRGLESGEYTVSADGVLYVKDARHGSWTAEELADGIDLVVGETRTVLFEIRPVAEGAAKRATGVITRAAIAELYRKLRPKLAKIAAEDAANERANSRPNWTNSQN